MEAMETLMRTCRATSRMMGLLLPSWECFWGTSIAASSIITSITLLSLFSQQLGLTELLTGRRCSRNREQKWPCM